MSQIDEPRKELRMKQEIKGKIDRLWNDRNRDIQDSADDLQDIVEHIEGILEAARDMGEID